MDIGARGEVAEAAAKARVGMGENRGKAESGKGAKRWRSIAAGGLGM
jgi:hypothetical protein